MRIMVHNWNLRFGRFGLSLLTLVKLIGYGRDYAAEKDKLWHFGAGIEFSGVKKEAQEKEIGLQFTVSLKLHHLHP